MRNTCLRRRRPICEHNRELCVSGDLGFAATRQRNQIMQSRNSSMFRDGSLAGGVSKPREWRAPRKIRSRAVGGIFVPFLLRFGARLRFGRGVGAMCASNRYAAGFYVVPFVFRRYRRTITDSPTDFIKRIRFIVLLSYILTFAASSAFMDSQSDVSLRTSE